jgi:two-component system sensor histidine kinase TctE
MLVPLLLLWPMSIAITYLVAKSIANQPFDHALDDSVTVLAQQVREVDGKVITRLPAARATCCAPTTSTASTSRSRLAGGAVIDGDREMPAPKDDGTPSPWSVHFRNDSMHGTPVRIAYSYVNLHPAATRGKTRAATGAGAGGRNAGQARATGQPNHQGRDPAGIHHPADRAGAGLVCADARAVAAGQLQERIRARRPDDLSPIDSRQVPEEISPLVGSLNDMLERLSQTIACKSASSPTPRTR